MLVLHKEQDLTHQIGSSFYAQYGEVTSRVRDHSRPCAPHQGEGKFVLVLIIAGGFNKFTQIVRVCRSTAYDVGINFTAHCVFQFGPPRTLLSENGP